MKPAHYVFKRESLGIPKTHAWGNEIIKKLKMKQGHAVCHLQRWKGKDMATALDF